MARLKSNDQVVIIAGKEKGKQGSIIKVIDNKYVLVQGLNKVKKHQKPNPQKGEQGGVVELEKPLHISNVAIFNTQTGKSDRVHYSLNDAGKKVRVYASTNEVIDL